MALVDDALAYEVAASQQEIDEAAHVATSLTFQASKDVRRAAYNLIQQQFPLEGHFVHAFASGLNTIVIEVNNGNLSIDIVVTE